MRILSLDLETTGLDPKLHGITEFGAVVTDLFDRNAPVHRFHRYLNPENYVWSTYCLALHADWIKHMLYRLSKDYIPDLNHVPICKDMAECQLQFLQWLWTEVNVPVPDEKGKWSEKLTLVGKNVEGFDMPFILNKGFNRGMFHRRVIDPGPLYVQRGDRVPPELAVCKQRAIASGLMIRAEVKHDALEDAMDVVQLLQHVYARDYVGPVAIRH